VRGREKMNLYEQIRAQIKKVKAFYNVRENKCMNLLVFNPGDLAWLYLWKGRDSLLRDKISSWP